MRLSPHFTLEELCRSDIADRLGMPNMAPPELILSLRAICVNVLEPIREHFGIPFRPTSGYRSYDLNAAMGGAKNSQHMAGEAVDIDLPGVPTLVLAQWVEENLNFDQVILEKHDPKRPYSGWVHVSYTVDRPLRHRLLKTVPGGYETVETFGAANGR